MVTAASDRRMRRRGGRRQKPGSTPADVGTALRAAREASDTSLVEIQDRTGVALDRLEALESGDLSPFPDVRSARMAVQRYCDLVEVDGDEFTGVVEKHWGTPLAGFDGAGTAGNGSTNGARTQSVYLGESASAGHLSRYPGDGTHLRAFTQTDEVPGVRRAELPAANGHNGNGAFHATGAFPTVPPVYAPPRAVPIILRGAIWVTVTVLALALGALALQHYDPQLLADIHVVHHVGTTVPTVPGGNPTNGGGSPSHPVHSSLVSLSNTGAGSATVSVGASSYTVVVAAWAPCWTVVHTPQSFGPVFAATLQGGQVKEFNPANGQLTLSMSASLVTVQVKVDGKTVPKWLFKPSSVPFTLNFNATTT